MRNLVYGFSGESNSGKTTLIVRLVERLSQKYRVVVLKHDPKSKAQIDVEGKDSDRFYKAGADVVLLSPDSTVVRTHRSLNFEEIVSSVGEVDYLFVEGLKDLSIPKLVVMRERIDMDYLDYVDAIVLGKGLSLDMDHKVILDIDDIEGILQHIKSHAREILCKEG